MEGVITVIGAVGSGMVNTGQGVVVRGEEAYRVYWYRRLMFILVDRQTWRHVSLY